MNVKIGPHQTSLRSHIWYNVHASQYIAIQKCNSMYHG